ncbi:hypothetical protein HY346_01575 [Candidatus Microgenomates bacterium]|nr:hypothetical protein [Candidatus Microgenomates bacterium]
MKLVLPALAGKQLRELRQSIGGSYLIVGPPASGKFQTVLALGAEIISHPADLLVIEPHPDSIGIDQIHQLVQQVALRPVGQRRLVVIRDAEKMTHEAQNALLKTLEEPPQSTAIVLTANERQRLLATIQSRCQTIAYAPLAEAAIAEHLQAQFKLSAPAAATLAEVSQGAIGLAVQLAQDADLAASYDRQIEQVRVLLDPKASRYQKLQLIGQIDNLPDLQRFLALVVYRLERLLRQAASSQSRRDICDYNRHLQTCERLLGYLQGNGNVKLAITQLVLEFS